MPAEDLPKVGLGTAGITRSDPVRDAIDLGYRHIDTAQKYENEDIVGEGLKQSEIAREEIFLASKIEEDNLAYDDVITTAQESLDRLQVETFDLLYIHWPATTDEDHYDPQETIPAFNELLGEGLTRHVGVANFNIDLIEDAAELLDAPIFAHQIEMHPLLPQERLWQYAEDHDMYLIAYCPIIQGEVDDITELRKVAEKHAITPAQASLAWLMNKENVIPIPKSSGSHLEENFLATAVTLEPEDIELIDSIDRRKRLLDFDKGPWNW